MGDGAIEGRRGGVSGKWIKGGGLLIGKKGEGKGREGVGHEAQNASHGEVILFSDMTGGSQPVKPVSMGLV
jgi:hypothetical protein